ncbi:hypothetical protein [Mycobacteroides chelonae]|uniref:hypothetical protein n=1 Tax=Mycobacteroides chelonae TaxID=1774 RepID=UPI002DEBA489|nr:hypothetical protein [Mycobacteroides chelonae]
MSEVPHATTSEMLEYFHDQLDAHFGALRKRRQQLGPPAPVFALEHGLLGGDLDLLHRAVEAAHRERLLTRVGRRWWLPFVVHAAEVGYNYDGAEYWPIYARALPSWDDNPYERDRVRSWFERFAAEYGGAIPQGAWAHTFRKIAWPITHAVLPRYLQVQLAKMLAERRTAWPRFLDDPHELGSRLHAWSRNYSDRLEKFCQNTALVGHVAVALLLSSDDDESPYITSTTLARLVDSLNSERQSRRWLQDARHSARVVRARNFRPPAATGGNRGQPRRLPAATDPKLQLKCEGDLWRAYAVLPDLKPLQHLLPSVYDELRNRRAVIAGTREWIGTSGLLYATPPIELHKWPAPRQPFLQLQRASQQVNLLIADQCQITSGPWWVFRQTPGAPAAEVKGKFVRPGVGYCIISESGQAPPAVPWCRHAAIAVAGVNAYDLQVPVPLSDTDAKALTAAGLSVISDVIIRPVGVAASSWDHEGSAEWLAGEPALIAIHAQHAPPTVQLTINGAPYYIDWPPSDTELFLTLNDLDVGTHEIGVSLGIPDGAGHKTTGTLLATIRDPQVGEQGTFAGEGIRLRTVPAQPSLPEVWDGHAVVMIDGPDGITAGLTVTLCASDGAELTSYHRNVQLPVTAHTWRQVLRELRPVPTLAKHYDQADEAHFAVSRMGVGLATLTCERGFQGLRWVLTARHHDGGYAARLVDRTDGDKVSVEFFSAERPLTAMPQPADREFIGPALGGLLLATSGEQVAGQIIPPDPTEMRRCGDSQPVVPTPEGSLAEITTLMGDHRRWKRAELPADPFGVRQRERVLGAITTAVAVMLAGSQWARFEQRIAGCSGDEIDLDRAQTLVGRSPAQRAAAESIAHNIWRWTTRQSFIEGFADSAAVLMRSAGMPNTRTGSRILLQLASSPGELLDWDEPERTQYLRCVLTDPVLMRAARFAVLGASAELLGGVG